MENSTTQKKNYFYMMIYISVLLVKLKSDKQKSNMRFGMSVSMFRLNIIGMTPVVVLVM